MFGIPNVSELLRHSEKRDKHAIKGSSDS